MKVLSLYIDKWYIVGTILDGANKTLLSLSNAEERVWLYFYSNSTTNAVKYSHSYRDEALAGRKGYYADVFDKLPDYREFYYEKYGARKKMSGIFADAGIFVDLKKSFEGESDVPVYLSFSKDIDIVAQDIFIKAMQEEHFKVFHFTLPIENLSLEYLMRHGKIAKETENVLVVNACNENLRYSIFNLGSDGVSVISQNCEPGYGVDSRKQAIVEEVLEYMQADTHFLADERTEWQDEMLYLSQFADDWLRKIDNSSGVAPVALGDIHFKKQVNNDVPVVVSVTNLNDRTKSIVGKLTGKIVDMIKESDMLLPQISNVVFLGDMFKSHTFANSLQQKIGISADKMVCFPDLVLPEIVGVYTELGETDFEEEEKQFFDNAKIKYEQDRKKYVELQTRDLKDKALGAEDEGRLQDAIDIYEQVLRTDKDDNFSSARISALNLQIEQERKNRELVESLMEKARDYFSTGDYTNAISRCEEVLRLQNDNSDAQKIKENSESVLKRQRLLEGYIQQINGLLMERHFYEARNMLLKVDALNINDVRLKGVRDKIEDGISQLESQVKDKINAYDAAYLTKDYQQCLRLSDELLSMGADSSIWTKKRQELREKIKQEQIFQDNYELARKARLNNDWNAVVDYAQKALEITTDNQELEKWIIEAKVSLKEDEVSRIQEEFSQAYANGLWVKVVELYNANKFIQVKSSNSTMYNNAKRFIRNGSKQESEIPSIKDDINIVGKVKSPQIGPYDTENAYKRKERPRPTRPKVAVRPQMGEASCVVKERNLKIKVSCPKKVDKREKSEYDKGLYQNKMVFNKPKR